MMQFKILFGDGDGGTRLIGVTLTAAEVKAAKAHACPDVCAAAMAMRHAYAQVPDGWYHYSDRIKQIVLQ